MKKRVSIVGGGTGGLFLAAFLDTDIYEVTIYEKKPSFGRKFLVAGDGGFNLTHGEELATFKSRYTPPSFLDNALDIFSNEDLRSWLLDIGIPTFIGSSGRVFPKRGIKPIEVLKAIESYLLDKNIKLEFGKTFTGWSKEKHIEFNDVEIVKSDYTVFALGGASWKVTGSDGSWLGLFNKVGIETFSFRSSNCAYKIEWPEAFIQKHEGAPLKNISIFIEGKMQKGEVVVTKFGLEGNAIYALSPQIRENLAKKKEAVVYLDFKPRLNLETLIGKIKYSKSNISSTLKDAIKLPKAVIDLIKVTLTKEEYLDIQVLSKYIKYFPLTLVESAPIDEAISTTGGISLNAVDINFQLKHLEGQFCIGEMLDWDAPTGGYLIQGCASMGVYLAHQLNSKKIG